MRFWRVNLVALVLVPGVLAAEINYETARLERRLSAVRTTEKITLDGRLDESSWSPAPIATNFIQNDPRPDEPASEATEVRVLYDTDYIYFGIHVYDSGRLVINSLTKDFNRASGDTVQIVLDTFHDERNGYLFAVNPAGAKWDAQMINEGREMNADWDGVWSVQTRIVEDGWVAEIAVPFKTLKFRSTDVQTWGINFQRSLRRKNEDSFWSPLPRIYSLDRVSLAGTLGGLEGVKPGANIRMKPYVVGSFGQFASRPDDYDGDFGMDVKYGLTSGLTWDFTYNTDFSQVEADEQQINLTRFSLFFPEKREFFLENSGIFTFGSNAERGVRATDMILFFSRRIGITEEETPAPILGGTRLTGRAGPFELGLLNIHQRKSEDPRTSEDLPGANFSVARLRRNVSANSDVGIMLVNKEEQDSPRFNRVLGGDANLRFGQKVSLNSYLAKAFLPSGGEGNLASRVGFEYRDTRLDFRSAYIGVQENFINEMGFVPRLGIHKYAGYLSWTLRPERLRGWIRSSSPHIHHDYVADQNGKIETRNTSYHIPIQFQNSSSINLITRDQLERVPEAFVLNRRRNISVPPGTYSLSEYSLGANSDNSRRISGSADWTAGRFYTGHKHSYSLGGTFRLNHKLNTSFSYSHNNINLPQGHFKTNLLSIRFSHSFSTTMFLNGLIQYNDDTRQWSSNIRFNLIHRPLSDLFVVYNERRDSASSDLIDRALIAKFTYMIAR